MTQKQRIIQLLLKIGLTESEAELYLAAHKYPKLTLANLRGKTNYSTASVYRAFDRLHGMGLLTSSQDNWRKSIEAVSLKALGEKLAKEQRNLKKVELELKQLDSIFHLTLQNEEDPIEIHSDENKIIDTCFQVLRNQNERLQAIGSGERLIDILGKDLERQFVDMRKRKGIKCDVVLTEYGPYAQELMPTNERDLRNMKVKIDPNNQDFVSYVGEDKVTILQKDEKLGKRAVVIKDPALKKMHENLFATLWKDT